MAKLSHLLGRAAAATLRAIGAFTFAEGFAREVLDEPAKEALARASKMLDEFSEGVMLAFAGVPSEVLTLGVQSLQSIVRDAAKANTLLKMTVPLPRAPHAPPSGYAYPGPDAFSAQVGRAVREAHGAGPFAPPRADVESPVVDDAYVERLKQDAAVFGAEERYIRAVVDGRPQDEIDRLADEVKSLHRARPAQPPPAPESPAAMPHIPPQPEPPNFPPLFTAPAPDPAA